MFEVFVVKIVRQLKKQQLLILIDMDFERLQPILSKRAIQWSTEDTLKWLQFISLPHLSSTFRNAGIDGSCIHLIDEEILKGELGIVSPIIRKKLLNWINFGLKGFDSYLQELDNKKIEFVPEFKKSTTTCMRPEPRTHNTHSYESKPVCRESQLTLEQFEGNSLGFHIIKNEAITIGSHKSNQIVSLETSISEKHVLIGKKADHSYYIQDLGSKYGTYVKINERMCLRNNMILEVGSYQFAVSAMDPQRQTLKLKQTLYTEMVDSDSENMDTSNLAVSMEGRNKGMVLHVDLKAKNRFTFGRRKENDFQKDDKHMSGMHCKITFMNGRFFIEDYGSTNGTWVRVSPESTVSTEVPLFNESIIKLGTAISYICRVSSGENKKKERESEMIDENTCKCCQEAENNCLFLPCSHNTCCMECSAKIGRFCPECDIEIMEKIRIHK